VESLCAYLGQPTVDEVFNTILAVCQRVQERSTHSYSFGTETQGFDDIGTSPNAAVDVDLEVLEDLWMVAPNL
jgi:hypothetical protein